MSSFFGLLGLAFLLSSGLLLLGTFVCIPKRKFLCRPFLSVVDLHILCTCIYFIPRTWCVHVASIHIQDRMCVNIYIYIYTHNNQRMVHQVN